MIDRQKLIEDATFVIDAGSFGLCTNLLDKLLNGFRRQTGFGLEEARLCSAKGQVEHYRTLVGLLNTKQLRCERPGGQVRHCGLVWREAEDFPPDVIMLETGKAHACIINLEV